MRFLTGLSRRHQGRRSAPGKKEPGAGKRRFRRGASASPLFRRRAAIISTILAALMVVGHLPATAAGTVTSTIPVGAAPRGVAVTPDGSTAYVTNAGSDAVSVIAVASGTVASTIPVGSGPSGVAFTPDGSRAYVTNLGSDTVSVIDVNSAPPVFTADTPPTKGTTRAAYSYAFTTTGDPAPTFYVSSGALPAGLSLDSTTGAFPEPRPRQARQRLR